MAKVQTRFRAKTWIYRAQAIIFGYLCVFGLTMGPLFLAGGKDANGRPARQAGIGLTAVTVAFFVPGFARAMYNLRARKAPMVRLYREGIEVRLIGRTTLDGIPAVPGMVRFAWGVLSAQAFRSQTLHAGWEEMHGAWVEGLPAMRVLILDGAFRRITGDSSIGRQIVFQQVDFKDSLQDLAAVIRSYFADPRDRAGLPSWSNTV